MPKRPIIAATLIIVALLAYLWWRSSGVQVPAAFSRIATAVDKGDAAQLLRELHPGYNFARQWPEIGAEIGDDQAARMNLKPLVLRSLISFFEMRATDPITMRYEIEEITPQDDGGVVAIVTIGFPTKNGDELKIDPPLEHHRFVLKRDGWLPPSLRVVEHAPIHYSY